MPTTPALPPALRSLLEAGGGLVRRSASGRVALARMADVVRPGLLPAAMRPVTRQLAAARDATTEPLAAKDVERALKGAWGKAPGKALDAFDDAPLAVRPATQVHRGEHDGTAVAIKILRPALPGAVRNDLALLDALAIPLRQVFGAMDAGAILREARETALDELDLEHEASTQRQARRLLRDVEDVTVPAPVLELCADGVLVSELLDGPTLAEAQPGDPGRVARALVAAHVHAARNGLVLTDPRGGHVVLLDGGGIGLLGAGVARPVARERVAAGLDAVAAVRAADRDAFVTAVSEALDLLPPAEAGQAYDLIAETIGPLLAGPARLDDDVLAEAGERGLRSLGTLLKLARVVTPDPHDLAIARSLGQVAALLARLEVTEDWGALLLDGR